MQHKIYTGLKIRHSVPKNHQVEWKIDWSLIMRLPVSQNSKTDRINRNTFSSPFIFSIVIFHRKRINWLKMKNYFMQDGKHPISREQKNPMNFKILGSNAILLPIAWEACLKWQEPEPLDREMLLTWTVHLDYGKRRSLLPNAWKATTEEKHEPTRY